MKINKITIIEIIVILLVIVALGMYFAPRFLVNQEDRKMAKIKSDNAIYTARVLEEFAQNKNAKASDIAQKIANSLNQTAKNPYNKDIPAYIFDNNCTKSCNTVSYDDSIQMIILTAYNNSGELVARTVIKPPSFVVYSKFDEKNK